MMDLIMIAILGISFLALKGFVSFCDHQISDHDKY